ncbi:hypothetical protein NQ317_007060 [Molorchus minor]|uniref:non-specific serine/threonine protein kinase n=1 Tax=Molorchus minor TaxID=1323400 RepID=A0ABQ9K4C7_9CUCU|nr:hypothetical protein NQ317_007060 [Molorchus minor]
MDKYEVIGTLGEGSFGRVYKAKQISNGNFVALKVISKRGRSSKELKGFRRECEIQRDLHHPNIIQMLDSFETENEIVVITEFVHKELTAVLGKEGYLSEERVQPIVWDLVSALYYLHSNRVLHRDLKPQNILLDLKNRAKLCDFGFARNMSTGTHVLTSIKGTPLYMAPELIDEQPYDYNADLWSLGCIIYELLMGTPPFLYSLHSSSDKIDSTRTDSVANIFGLLQKNPLKRMTWEEILNHSFVKGHIILSKNIAGNPLTRPMSATTLQEKEQQRKDSMKNKQVKSASKCSEGNDQSMADNKKSSTSKNSKTSQNSNNVEGCKNSSNPDINLNNVILDESLDNLYLETKNRAVTASSQNTKDCEERLEIDQNKNHTFCLREKLKFIEDCQPIETDEWIVFLQKSIQEVINGDMSSLVQPSQTNIIVSPLRNANANSKVLSFVARLLSIPFVVKGITDETLSEIKKVYLDVKLVPNLVYASKLLLREYREDTPSGASVSPSNTPVPAPTENYKAFCELHDEDLQTLEYMFLLISNLVHVDDKFLIQFCDAVVVLNVYQLMKRFLFLTKHRIRVVVDVIAILTHVLRKFPENCEIVEKILFAEFNQVTEMKQICFVRLLRHSNPLLKERMCYFLLFIGKNFSENKIMTFWNDTLKETLEALVYDSMDTVRNAAEITVSELKNKQFYLKS